MEVRGHPSVTYNLSIGAVVRISAPFLGPEAGEIRI
jgi:hypothetical protein